MPPTRLGFPRTSRLLRPGQFTATMRRGHRSRDNFFTVYALPNAMPQSRLGLTVSRRCAPQAVARNTIKRHIREMFRSYRPLQPSLDIVVVAQSPAAGAGADVLRRSLDAHWSRLESLCAR
ncbi:MAG: ribonuclease P protein component [Pseudomonadota bacterium]|nr:MAG: ribonuclease P protein component [Pseudomonadota bacterium]